MIEIYRHELKYVCTDMQSNIIRNRLECMVKPDANAGADGSYMIKSIYFDDFARRCYYENENGVDPRYKYRIRIYNNSRKRISLERKTKKNGMTGKESCAISEDLFHLMISDNDCIDFIGKNSLLDEWIIEKNERQLKPTVIVEYKRIPLIYNLGNVRITFDSQIKGSGRIDSFFDDESYGILVMPAGYQVMEVKYDDYMPDILFSL